MVQSFVNPSSISGLDLKAQELRISPNPANDEILIDWEKAKGGMDYEIINANGQTMTRGHSYLNRVKVDQLPAGIYVIISSAEGETRMARFVRQ